MKLSVITACYNSQATVRYTIDSFLAQTHPDKELLIIDGASRDDTLKIVNSYQAPEIRIFSEPDKGVYDAMNKGLALFSGDAVGCLNSDDAFYHPGALSAIARGLEDADIVYGDLLMVTDHETRQVVREWRTGPYNSNAFQLGWQPPHPSFYMRRQVVEKTGLFDLSYVITADYDYMLRALALGGFRAKYINEVIAAFQMGGLSTQNWRAALTGTMEALRSRRAHLKAPPVDAAVFLRLTRRLFQLRKVSNYWRPNRLGR